jgi:hypothetical protein
MQISQMALFLHSDDWLPMHQQMYMCFIFIFDINKSIMEFETL